MKRPHAPRAAALVLVMLVGAVAVPAHAPASHDILSGTWLVDRRCVSGCFLSQTVTITVAPQGHGAYSGKGANSQPLELYQVARTQVIVHASKASSLLTIHSTGRYMTGVGVGKDGQTFATSWKCLTGPPARGKAAGKSGRCGTE